MASREQLLAALQTRHTAAGRELAAELRISQPTLSRLIKAAGDRVCRIGRGRATRYALVRSIPGLGSRLPVYRVDATGSIRPYAVLHLLGQRDFYWLEREEGPGQAYSGLPPFGWDMSPQGYLGRNFSILYPELNLPPRISDWNDDHRLIALARRGEDCVGNLIIGSESADRFLAGQPKAVRPEDYPRLALTSQSEQPGSSAGGEQPKFAVYAGGRHVIVKFTDSDSSPATTRWRDLLLCENSALKTVRRTGIQAAASVCFDISGRRFLEVERFDRIGARGRRGVVSLAALDNQYHGCRDNWARSAQRFLTEPHVSIDREDVRRVRWLDTFGQLIWNSDRHFGNISFFAEENADPLLLKLTPLYDMLPMAFAPEGSSIVDRPFTPQPPTAETLDVWHDAAHTALAYWNELTDLADLSGGFRVICSRCRDTVKTFIERYST